MNGIKCFAKIDYRDDCRQIVGFNPLDYYCQGEYLRNYCGLGSESVLIIS